MLTDFRYFPREDLVQTVRTLLDSGLSNAITMFAARRMGKTQFVRNELLPATEAWHWHSCYVDLWVRRDEPELALVEELERSVREQGLLRRIKPDSVKARAGYAGTGIEAQWQGASASDDLALRLRQAMRQLVSLADEAVLLVIDEFQALATGRHEAFVATFRATMLELQPKLKIFFTGSSREALNSMFRKRKAPLFESAMPMSLPELGRDFVEDRAEIFRQMTRRQMVVDDLDQVFQRVSHVPMYLNQIVMHTVVSLTADPWEGFRRWQEDMGEAGLREQWSKLKAIDQIILQHLAHERPESLFGSDFSALVSTRLADGKPYTPQRIQTVVNRLTRAAILAPKGEAGEYEIEDRAFAIYLAAHTSAD